MTAAAGKSDGGVLFRFVYRADATDSMTLDHLRHMLYDLQNLLRVGALVSMHVDSTPMKSMLDRFDVRSMHDIEMDRLLENANEVQRFPVTEVSYHSPMEVTLWFAGGGATAAASIMLTFGNRLIDLLDRVQRSRTTREREAAERSRETARRLAYDRLSEALTEADMSPALRDAVIGGAVQIIESAANAAVDLDRIEPVDPPEMVA